MPALKPGLPFVAAVMGTIVAAEQEPLRIKQWPTDKPVRAFDARLTQMFKNRVIHHEIRSKHQPHQGKREIERRRKQIERDAKRAAKASE